MNMATLTAIDSRILEASRSIKVLTRLSWPADAMLTFLDRWHRGNPQPPCVDYPDSRDLQASVRSLSTAVSQLASLEGPVARFLRETARSYLVLCDLLQSAGTRRITEFSRELYGSPGDLLSDGRISNLDAARHFIQQSDQYYKTTHLHEADYCVPAQVIKEALEARLSESLPPGTIRVVIDPHLASKAAAGAARIRLRGGTCFSGYDLEQLLQHEALVHSLTALNGREQTSIRCLGLGAPRTTGTQEGLATFAEVITGAIDIDRLERIALRVIAIDMVLRGADFIEIFRFFLEAGQPETESFSSAMRIFRGAPLDGGAALTKDVVYVHGLMEVHTFFRWAMRTQRMALCRYLFAGRMTIGDAIELAPMFENGILKGPRFLPPWMTKTNGLAGYLAFSIFANRVSIEQIHEHHRFERVEDLSA